MKITFDFDETGEPIIMVDGEFAARAKDCPGYTYVETHVLATAVNYVVRDQTEAEICKLIASSVL